MKYVDEFRDGELAKKLVREVDGLVEPGRTLKIMEVCGGHTHTIYKYGVDDLLPENVELVHGPGCPVCVIPMGRVDDGIALARNEDVILTCFGDMMRVPGSDGTFLDAKAEISGVRRAVSVALCPEAEVGDWVLVHVGFALSRIDEEQARETLALLEQMGEAYEQELREIQDSVAG